MKGVFDVLKDKLPIIGAVCLLILTIVNFMVKNETVTGIVGISLFIFVLVLYIISRSKKEN
jgi:hypothetical protein